MQLLSTLVRRLSPVDGFTMPMVMGSMVVIMGLTLVAFTAASGDMGGARRDQDYKRAYAAAEAGVNEYLFRLNADQSYWTKCTGVAAPAKVNQVWNGAGADPRERRTLVGSDAQYAIELLPNPPAKSCDPLVPTSMIDPSSGTFRIRSTGFVRGTKRSIIATYRRVGFLDFLYYTDLETLNPALYKIQTGGYNAIQTNNTNPVDVQKWASDNCSKPYEQRQGASIKFRVDISKTNRPTVTLNCIEITFKSGDATKGPMHTNDQFLICGNPSFGRSGQPIKDKIEVVSKSGWRSGCSGTTPDFKGEPRFGAGRLDAPPVVSLKAVADDDYQFTGRTKIVLNGNSLTINDVPYAWPAKGVIYVSNDSGTCSFYDPTKTEVTQPACGDVEVSGTYSKDLTIAAEKDIKIVGNITQVAKSNSMLGLIAQSFIRVQHKVTSQSATWDDPGFDWSCSNGTGTPTHIDAAMLVIDHSFTADNYYCGASLGNLEVFGAIAQRYRGPVGTTGGTGFIKSYEYDDRLRYRQPPYFLDPIQTGWRVIRQTEQAPAR